MSIVSVELKVHDKCVVVVEEHLIILFFANPSLILSQHGEVPYYSSRCLTPEFLPPRKGQLSNQVTITDRVITASAEFLITTPTCWMSLSDLYECVMCRSVITVLSNEDISCL